MIAKSPEQHEFRPSTVSCPVAELSVRVGIPRLALLLGNGSFEGQI